MKKKIINKIRNFLFNIFKKEILKSTLFAEIKQQANIVLKYKKPLILRKQYTFSEQDLKTKNKEYLFEVIKKDFIKDISYYIEIEQLDFNLFELKIVIYESSK